MAKRTLVVGVGDIHGRFHRVQDWLGALERALERAPDQVLAVGDVEAFTRPDDHRRKAVKRQMPAEFADYAAGTRPFQHPLAFIGGNNEDFEALDAIPDGGELISGVRYLGRSGVRTLAGIRVGYLSGIYAPRFFEQPRVPPTTRETIKQAGYFRRPEVEALEAAGPVDLLVVHEWPRGLFARNAEGKVTRPWMGNPVTRRLVDKLRPAWLWCGHSHQAHAAALVHEEVQTRVSCLDQATRAEGAIFWLEWEDGQPVRGGWGISGRVDWVPGHPWDAGCVPRPAPE